MKHLPHERRCGFRFNGRLPEASNPPEYRAAPERPRSSLAVAGCPTAIPSLACRPGKFMRPAGSMKSRFTWQRKLQDSKSPADTSLSCSSPARNGPTATAVPTGWRSASLALRAGPSRADVRPRIYAPGYPPLGPPLAGPSIPSPPDQRHSAARVRLRNSRQRRRHGAPGSSLPAGRPLAGPADHSRKLHQQGPKHAQ